MKAPTQCIFWEKPELAFGTMKEQFELLETVDRESHWWRYVLKCRECGQRYFFEFYEEVDWDEGNDPQRSTFIPVETDDEIAALKQASVFDLTRLSPRLVRTFPKDAEQPTTAWVR